MRKNEEEGWNTFWLLFIFSLIVIAGVIAVLYIADLE